MRWLLETFVWFCHWSFFTFGMILKRWHVLITKPTKGNQQFICLKKRTKTKKNQVWVYTVSHKYSTHNITIFVSVLCNEKWSQSALYGLTYNPLNPTVSCVIRLVTHAYHHVDLFLHMDLFCCFFFLFWFCVFVRCWMWFCIRSNIIQMLG